MQAPLLGHDDYPRLTQVTQTELISQRVDTRKEVERCVDIGWLHSEEACLERIGEAVEKGNCITLDT